jgi:hypothetical protein
MKMKFFKAAGFVVALAASLGSAYVAGVHAQQSTTAPGGSSAATNWIGYLVVGQSDTIDPIAINGPHPTVARQVEIGLRSDGTVVWRRVFDAK